MVDDFVEFDKQYKHTFIRVKYEKRPEQRLGYEHSYEHGRWFYY